MINYTKTTLDKLQNLFSDLSYTVRYEKGTFQSGYALVENKKIVVINKFFDTEGRVSTLFEILGNIEVDEKLLSERSLKLYKMYKKLEADTAR